MIIDRYLQRNVHLGTLGALAVLVSLSLVFVFVRELGDIGQGSYDMTKLFKYMLMSIPSRVVEFMPLAVLLGSILTLGALASNSEIIAMLASGVSLKRLLFSVLQASVLIAGLTFVLADWVVPVSEDSARALRSISKNKTSALRDKQGLWIKDGDSVLRIGKLFPDGYAQQVEVYRLDAERRLVSVTRADSAIPLEQGWELQQAVTSYLHDGAVVAETSARLEYSGGLSRDLLRVLMIKPRRMSTGDLHAYLEFLDNNQLEAGNERLIFWQKVLAPMTIVVMSLLAFPFLLGSQRQTNAGQRLMTGIILGLTFVVVDRLVFQFGNQMKINALLVTALPNLLFLGLALYLLYRRQSHVVGRGRRVVGG
ncbi:MAG: LPS export ABC transporter permease LptG [Gammaproteobacteria bacterium]|nr:LPS export ABC transporter permease LptG [Gammaproteobacteria bacterium]